MRRHEGAKVKHFDVSNVIYHKFSHGAVSYTLNGENVNVMLEYILINDKSAVRKYYFNHNITRMKMEEYCHIFKWTLLKRTSPNVYSQCHQGRKCARQALVM